MPLSKHLKNVHFLAGLPFLVIWEIETDWHEHEGGKEGGNMEELEIWSTYENEASVTGQWLAELSLCFLSASPGTTHFS